ncbi:hypothetical protein DFP72DRAFT_1058062 [Ephemerocybe angulata]|uniref:Uncharacterized protein n=1 Tax=Ephemerocybe angulata TaxID=980116 RepID=A0A8H6IHC0_9AGAR|nr:hypothetical protein DFP72DRAFT_1058062 [Tulosesus angulatus]
MDPSILLAQVINEDMLQQHGLNQNPAVVELQRGYIRGIWTLLDNEERLELLKVQPLRLLKQLEEEGNITRNDIEILIESQLHDRFSDFDLEFDATMHILDKHDAYITGQFTLGLIDGGFKTDEIDFHIPAVQTTAFINSMITQGFTELDKDIMDGVEGGKRANVISCEKHPLVSIAHFHSTVSMNYIAHHGLVLLYPALTLRRAGLSNGGPWDTHINAFQAIQKYQNLGYTITVVSDVEGHCCGSDPSCPQAIRSLQDKGVCHFRWADFRMTRSSRLRTSRDARKCIWQLATGDWCVGAGGENTGMVMVNGHCEVIKNNQDCQMQEEE